VIKEKASHLSMFELKTLTDYSDESLLAEMRRVVVEFKGDRLTRELFDTLSRVHSTTLSRRFGSWTDALDRAGISTDIAPRPRRVTREMLLGEIEAYAKEFGEPPKLDDIAERLDIHRTTIHRFGKWPALLKELGLRSVPLGRRYTDEECFENIVELWTHYGRQPSFRELTCAPSRVGTKAYVRRWGGWRAALGAFISYVNQAAESSDTETPTAADEPPSAAQSSNMAMKVRPRSLGLAMRYKVLCRDRFCCQICGRSPAKDIGVELHVDHIHPWSKGGETRKRTSACYVSIATSARVQNWKHLSGWMHQ
jgi:Homing endonuclease associated repeat/HNH endonuclease